MSNKERITEYLKTVNLGDYDLDGCEINEEDIEFMATHLEKITDIEQVVNDYLFSIRKVLD